MPLDHNCMRAVVLASTSVYRQRLLARVLPAFECCSPAIDETPLRNEPPLALVSRLSQRKAAAVAGRFPNALIIGSDQVGVVEDRIICKPRDEESAVQQLMEARGKTLSFLTGVSLLDTASGRSETRVDEVLVRFRSFSEAQARRYIQRDQPLDCAGSFKVEGLGITLFEAVESRDPTSLEGLPLITLTGLLLQFGVDLLD